MQSNSVDLNNVYCTVYLSAFKSSILLLWTDQQKIILKFLHRLPCMENENMSAGDLKVSYT